jgi:outer membrane lipase/esterase
MKLKANRIGWLAARAGLLLAAAMGVSCGGGTQGNSFTAKRVFAFGDESSVINADGSKYTVNALKTDNITLDCASNPIWVQSVAALYGLVFPECNVGLVPVAAPASRIYAASGAKVADLAAQIDRQVAVGGFAADDLATVLVGSNDIVAQFARYPGVPATQLADELKLTGGLVAGQVKRLADLGAKVLVSTAPDLGRAPFAGDRSAGSTNLNPAVLALLSTAFNDGLLAEVAKQVNDGHKVGLIQLDTYLQAVDNARINGGGTFANTTLAACLPSAPLPTCTSLTLGTDAAAIPPPAVVSNASAATWLWADALHLSAGGQAGLGALASSRAQNNPF